MVQVAYDSIQQEESQYDVLNQSDIELFVMLSRTQLDSKAFLCTVCVGHGHSSERC